MKDETLDKIDRVKDVAGNISGSLLELFALAFGALLVWAAWSFRDSGSPWPSVGLAVGGLALIWSAIGVLRDIWRYR